MTQKNYTEEHYVVIKEQFGNIINEINLFFDKIIETDYNTLFPDSIYDINLKEKIFMVRCYNIIDSIRMNYEQYNIKANKNMINLKSCDKTYDHITKSLDFIEDYEKNYQHHVNSLVNYILNITNLSKNKNMIDINFIANTFNDKTKSTNNMWLCDMYFNEKTKKYEKYDIVALVINYSHNIKNNIIQILDENNNISTIPITDEDYNNISYDFGIVINQKHNSYIYNTYSNDTVSQVYYTKICIKTLQE